MRAFRQACARFYAHPGIFALVMLLTAVATFCRVRGTLNGHALAHWLINYEEGFIKRGLMGTVFQLRRVSEVTGIPVEALFWFWVNVFLIMLYLAVMYFCWQIYRRDRDCAFAVTPYFIAGPLLVSNTSFIGYFDQIISLLVLAMALLMLSGHRLTVLMLAMLGVFVHENMVLFALPFYALWIWLGICFQDRWCFTRQSTRHNRLELLLPLLTLVCFSFVYYYYEHVLSFAEKSEYIARTIAPYEAFRRGPESIIRTLTTSYSNWWATEHEWFSARMQHGFGIVGILLPMAGVASMMANAFARKTLEEFLCFVIFYGLILAPLFILAIAFDVFRFLTFPVPLALVALYWFAMRKALCHTALVVRYGILRWTMLLGLLFVILVRWPYLDLDLPQRLLCYTPLLFWYFCYLLGTAPGSESQSR